MSTLTVQLPESLRKSIESLATKEGYSVSQFLASAAGEKLAVVMTMDYLRREDFEKYLAVVPDVTPPETIGLSKSPATQTFRSSRGRTKTKRRRELIRGVASCTRDRPGRREQTGGFSNDGRRRSLAPMKFVTTLERDEDGVWVAECPSIPGCVSQGKTREEALANIREAIAACLEVRAERGLPLTVETQQVEVTV